MTIKPNRIGQRLRNIREIGGHGSISKFAPLLKVDKNTLQAYESGRSIPELDFLTEFAEKTEADFNELLRLRLASGKTSASHNLARYLEANETKNAGEYVYLKVYSVAASAGPGSHVDEELISSKIAFRRDWLEKEHLINNKLAVLEAKGDSMEPTIINGDSILISEYFHKQELGGKSEIKLGLKNAFHMPGDGIYVIRMDGHLAVKRVQVDGQGGLKIISDNPAYETISLYPKSIIELADTNQFSIVGRVEWIGRRI